MNRAVNYGLKVISNDTGNWAYYSNLGRYYEYLKDFPEALKNYNIALSKGAAAYPVFYEKGILQMRVGEYHAAVVTFRLLIDEVSMDIISQPLYQYLRTLCYLKIAKVHALQGDVNATIATLREAKIAGSVFPTALLLNECEFRLIASDQTYLEYINNEY